jgi:alpha-beta hydrolase superfamily lysophospholipase
MRQPAFYKTCADGHKMPVYQWLPETKPVAVVHIAHGMAEYGARYERFALALNAAGIAVFANDHRGHGLAVSDTSQLGVAGIDWVNWQLKDLHLLILELKMRFSAIPFFLMGHSMGSFLAQRFVQLHSEDVDGLVLSGTNGAKDPLLPAGIFLSEFLGILRGKAYRSKLINKLTFGKFNEPFKPARTHFDWLSRDSAEVDKYVANPYCGFICSVQLLHDLFVSLQITFDARGIREIRKDLKVYAFAGDKDPVGLQGRGFMKLVENWKSHGISNFEYKLYPNGRHEMLNEINRDEVTTDCIKWILKQIA